MCISPTIALHTLYHLPRFQYNIIETSTDSIQLYSTLKNSMLKIYNIEAISRYVPVNEGKKRYDSSD